MLSMFQGKKGFSVLFTNRESQLASPRPPPSARESRVGGASPVSSRQSSHRCERCARLFRADNTVAAVDLLCTRCEFTTCPLCREPRVEAEEGTVAAPWQCCVCAMPHTLMRLFGQTRQGPSLVLRVMEFCDPRAERVLKSLFRTVVTVPTNASANRTAVTTGEHPVARALPASKRISLHAREVRKSGTVVVADATEPTEETAEARRSSGGSKGLRQRSKSGANQQPLERSKTTHRNTVHEDSEEAALAEAENVISGSLERTMMDALTFAPTSEASRTVNRKTSSHSVGAFGMDVSVSGAALVSVSEASHSCSVGGHSAAVAPATTAAAAQATAPETKSRSSAAFEREQQVATPRTNVSVETRMTRTDGPTLSLSPLPKDTQRARSEPSSDEDSCRSASPAPRFPSYTEFLGDQEVVRTMQGGRATGEVLSVSPDSDLDDGDYERGDVVELGAKRPSNTLNGATSTNRMSGTVTHPQPGTPPTHARRTIHDGSAKRAATALGRRRSSSSRVRRSASGFAPRSVYKRQSSRRSNSRLTAHSTASSTAPALPLYQPIKSISLSVGRASGSVQAEVGTPGTPADAAAPTLRARKATPTKTVGDAAAKRRLVTPVACGTTGPRRAPLATRTAGRILGTGAKSSGTSTPLNHSLNSAPACTRGVATGTAAGRFGRTNSGTAGSGFQRTASTANGKLTRTTSSSKHLATTPSAALKRTNSSAKHVTSPTPLARTQSRRASSPPSAGGAEAAETTSPALGTRLVRTQSSTAGGFTRTKSGNKLTRTASSTAGAGRGMATTAPATGSGTRLKRTATATTSTTTPTTTGLKRTKSANPGAYTRTATLRARSGSQAQATPKRLVRVGSAHTPITRTGGKASPKAGTATTTTTTTPLRRTNTATPKRHAGATGATPLTRTATSAGAGRFERKATQRRIATTSEPQDDGASPSATGVVEDAPKLVHIGARRGAAAAETTSSPAGKARATKTIKTAGGSSSSGTGVAHRFGRTATRTRTMRPSAESSCGATEHGSQARSNDGHAGATANKTPTRRVGHGATTATATPQHAEKVSRRATATTTTTGTAPFGRQNSSRAAFGRQASRNAALQK